MCQQVLILSKGRLVAVGSPEQLGETLNPDSRLRATAQGEPDTVLAAVRSVPGICKVELESAADGQVTFTAESEDAADRRAAGMSLTQAAVSAAKARLRPILMTVLTCVFGMIPLVFSHGVGANGNSTLGSGVVGGMIVGTLALLFLVPTLFIVFQTLQEKVKPLEFDPDPQWAVRAELEECKNEKE